MAHESDDTYDAHTADEGPQEPEEPEEAGGEPPKPKRRQRKRPPQGMTMRRMQEIKDLIEQGRGDEVNADEMAEYEKGSRDAGDSLKALFEGIDTPSVRSPANLQLIEELRQRFSAPVLRNMDAQSKVSEAFTPQSDAVENLGEKLFPPKRHLSTESISKSWLERVDALKAEEARQENERYERAQAAAEENNALLAEVARILQSVESSTAQSQAALRELGEMRRESDKSSGRQFWINIMIAAAALVASVLQVLGIGGNNDPQPQPTVTVTATPSPEPTPTPTEPPAPVAPPAAATAGE